MDKHETAQVIVTALGLLGRSDALPQLPNRRLTPRERLAATPRHSALHKHVMVALWQPEAIKRFREAMEVYEAVEDSRMRVQ